MFISFCFRPFRHSINVGIVALSVMAVMVFVRECRAQSTGSSAAVASARQDTAAPAETGDTVATVNGQPIVRSDVERSVNAALQGQKIDPAMLPTLQASVLQQMIEQRLLNEFMLTQKGAVTGADINAAMNEVRASLQKHNMSMSDFLAGRNMTESAFRAQLAWQLMWGHYVEQNTTEESLLAFFDEHHELFDGTKRRASHILLRPEGAANQATVKALIEKADELRSQINSGEIGFEQAAAKYSAGPSRQRGGDLGYIPRTGVMVEAFSQAVYSLEPNEISEPVPTPFGIHLIKVMEVKPGTKKLAEVRPLVQQAYSQHLMQKLVEDQQNTATIEFAGNYPHFKPGTREVVMPGGEILQPPSDDDELPMSVEPSLVNPGQ